MTETRRGTEGKGNSRICLLCCACTECQEQKMKMKIKVQMVGYREISNHDSVKTKVPVYTWTVRTSSIGNDWENDKSEFMIRSRGEKKKKRGVNKKWLCVWGRKRSSRATCLFLFLVRICNSCILLVTASCFMFILCAQNICTFKYFSFFFVLRSNLM